MAMIYDMVIAAIIGTIIFVIIYKVRNKDLVEPFNFLSAIFESYLSGMTIYVGFASLWYSVFESLPFNLSTIANEKLISFFGGLSLISITVIVLFRKEILSKGKLIFFKDEETKKSEISVERINYCHAYHQFKNRTNDSELEVISLFKDGKIQVNTRSVNIEINKNLIFDLMIKLPDMIQNRKEDIPSQPIASCKLITQNKISLFKIVKWHNIKEYKEKITELKQNKKIKNLKPFLKLQTDYYADKYKFDDLNKAKESIINLMNSQGGEKNGA